MAGVKNWHPDNCVRATGHQNRSLIRKTSRLLLETVILAVVALITFAGISAWRLSKGPISLDFVSPYVTEALTPEDGSFAVKLETTVLTWEPTRRSLEIRALGVRAVDRRGHRIVAAPAVSIGFSVKALLRGLVAPTSLMVLGPKLRLTRSETGRVTLGPAVDEIPPEAEGQDRVEAESGPEAAGEAEPPILIRDLLAKPDPSRSLGYLKEVIIVQAELVVDDRRLGVMWHAPEAEVRLARDVLGIEAEAHLDVEIEGRRSRFDAVGIYNNNIDRLDLAVGFRGFEPAVLAGGSPELAQLASLKLALDGNVRLSMSRAGVVDSVELDIRRGAGTILLPDELMPDLQVDDLHAQASFDRQFERVKVQDLTLKLDDGTSVSLSGEAEEGDGARELSAVVSVHGLDITNIGRYWPKTAAGGARKWIVANIHEGRIAEIQAQLRGRAPSGGQPGLEDSPGDAPPSFELTSLRGAMLYEGLAITYSAPLPPARDIAGAGTFDLSGFDLRISGGKLEGLAVGKSSVRIVGLDRDDQDALVEATVVGELRQALEFLDHEGLGYASKLGIDPAATSGRTIIKLNFGIPLLANLHFEQVDMEVAADISDMTWKRAVLDRDVSDGQLTLNVGKDEMKVRGTARYVDVPLELNWLEHFADRVKFRRRVNVRGVAAASNLSAFGMDLERYLAGRLPLELVYTAFDKAPDSIGFKLDLSEAVADVPELDWRKEAGQSGDARFTMILNNGEIREVRDVKVEAEGLVATGSATFAPKSGALATAEIERLVVGATDLRGSLRRSEEGVYAIDVQGEALDISALLRPGESEGDYELPPLRANGRVAKLYTRPGRYLADSRLTAHYDGRDWREIRFEGGLGHSSVGQQPGRLVGSLLPEGERRVLTIQSDDAGAVSWTFGLSDNIQGGKLDIAGGIDDRAIRQPLDATILMTDYKLVKAPLAARVLTVASLTGIASLLSGEGITFSRLEVPFVKSDDVVTVTDARAIGSELGFTLSGTVDLAQSKVELAGTIVPVYTLNSLLGKIPFVGQILVGEKGSGVFAGSYRIKGPLDDPEVAVNPLAALTPGFLRYIFGYDNSPQKQDAEVPPDDALPERR